jgi:hypothetical protein
MPSAKAFKPSAIAFAFLLMAEIALANFLDTFFKRSFKGFKILSIAHF